MGAQNLLSLIIEQIHDFPGQSGQDGIFKKRIQPGQQKGSYYHRNQDLKELLINYSLQFGIIV